MRIDVVRTWVRGAFISLSIGAGAFGQAAAAVLTPSPSSDDATTRADLVDQSADQILSAAPLSFEVNAGQFDASVKYVTRSPSQEIRFTHDAVKFDLLGDARRTPVTMSFAGHAASPVLGAREIVQKQSHYFIGNDATQWRTHIPNFARVEYDEMYPGIDVAFYGNGSELEYDVVVAPGAELAQVRMNFDGADRVRVTEVGDLVLDVGERQWVHRKPVAYQVIDGQRRAVDSRYVALNETAIGFATGEFDHTQPLIVDPVIVASRYFSYQGSDNIVGMALTPAGDVVIAGRAYGPNNTGMNAFVARLNSTLTQVMSQTWIGGGAAVSGGTAANYRDEPYGLAVDNQGNAYITGSAESGDFPLVNKFQGVTKLPEAFVTKISADGSTLLYSTYLGGNSADSGNGIAVDEYGAAYVTGFTVSTNFPLAHATMPTRPLESFTTFISKLSPAGNVLEFSTYFGGAGSNQTQSIAKRIAVDAAQNVYVAGTSNSPSFPQVGAIQSGSHGATDAFLAKIGPDYQLKFSTLLGGASDDSVLGMAIDDQQRVTLTGSTTSANFPTQNAFQPAYVGSSDAFIARIDTANPALILSSYFGGSGQDQGWGVTLDRAGIAYITGYAVSTNLPLKNAFRSTPVLGDAFVAAFGAQGDLLFSSYLGGREYEAGTAVVVGQDGSILIAGHTSSDDYPNNLGVTRPPVGGGYYADFVTKLSKLELAPIAVAGGDIAINEGEPTTLDGSASYDPNGDTLAYAWNTIAGPAVVLNGADSAQPTFVAPNVPAGGATLTFQLIVSDGALTSAPALVNVTIKDVNHAPVADAGSNQTVSEGSPVNLDGAQSYDVDGDTLSYQWQQVSGTSATLTTTTEALTTFDAPQVGASGETLRFALTVDDGAATHTAYVGVRVENVNHAPVANAGAQLTVNEGSLVALDGSASSDPDSDALTFAWQQVGGQHSISLLDSATATPTFTAPQVSSGGDTLEFELYVRDQEATSAPSRITVTVLDTNDPPACDLARADVTSLWPPNHKLIPLTITGVRDPNDDSITLTVLSVTSDEPVNGLGDGDTTPDAVITDGRASVRAERAGSRNGRVYVVNFIATDTQGASCSGSTTIGVPQNKNSLPLDSGQSYDATRP